MRNASNESLLSQFEDEFFKGNSPDIDNYLRHDVNNSELFHELLHTELELRIRSGEPVRVEAYLQRYPELKEQNELIDGLIKTEFNTRQHFDPEFDRHEYPSRFPSHFDRLADSLLTTSQNQSTVSSKPQLGCRKVRLHQQGGLGNVWEAKDKSFRRKIALKEIRSKYREDAVHQERFFREATLTAFMQHPGVVPVYDYGEFGDGSHCYTMRFVEGSSLHDAISKVHSDSSPPVSRNSIAFQRLLRRFVDCCNTISYAHSIGVIHGDIKPGNVMVGKFGETIVVDWGLARLLPKDEIVDCPDWRHEMMDQLTNIDDSPDKNSLIGHTAGSPAFMSPEQLSGQATLDTRSDIYGLGATLLCIVFNIRNPNQQADQSPLRCPKDLQPLHSICKKAMSKKPCDRYDSVNELILDVENYLADQPLKAHVENLAEKVTRNSRRYRAVLNTALIAMSLLAFTSLLFVFWIHQEREIAIAARNMAMQREQETDQALKKVTETKNQLEKQIQHRSKLLEALATIHAGPGSCGYGKPMNAQQMFQRLVSDADLKKDPLTKGYLAGIRGKQLHALLDHENSVEKYRESVELLTQTLAEDDPIVLEYRLGLATSLIPYGFEFNRHTPNRKTAFDEAQNIVESILYDYVPQTKVDHQIRYLAMTALPSIHIEHGDTQSAIDSMKVAAEYGQKYYEKNGHHFLVSRLLSSHAKLLAGDINVAEQEFNDLLEDLGLTPFVDLKVKTHRELYSAALYRANQFRAKKQKAQEKKCRINAKHQIETALKLAIEGDMYGKQHPMVRDLESILINCRIILGETQGVQLRLKELMDVEMKMTSPGSRRTAYSAFSYVNFLKRTKDKQNLKLMKQVSIDMLKAIDAEENRDRIPPKVLSRFKRFANSDTAIKVSDLKTKIAGAQLGAR